MQILWQKFNHNNYEANIDECGIEQGISGRGYKYTVEKNAVIHYITRGSGIFKYNNTTYTLKEGDGFLLLKGMEVEYISSDNDPWEYYWVGFSGIKLNEYLLRTSIITSHIFSINTHSKIPFIIKEMCYISKHYDPMISHDIYLINKIYELIYTFIKEFPKKFNVDNDLTHSYIQTAVDFINENYMEDITVEIVAAHVNLSRSYLYKLFVKYLNQSIKSYIINIRMYHACKLLKNSPLSISKIAASVGYKNPFLFSKIFTKHLKMSPSLYRNQYTQL
jgi:AraC-like DNA-binding protein